MERMKLNDANEIMKTPPTLMRALFLCALALFVANSAGAAEKPPHIAASMKPDVGSLQLLFHGSNGPYLIQYRDSLDASAPWKDLPTSVITEVQPGVFTAFVPSPTQANLSFYRILSQGSDGAETQAWTALLKVSSPANGTHFVAGEAPTVTVTILDTLGSGLSRVDFSNLGLYMYGPQEPLKTVTPVKLLKTTSNRSVSTHHYVNLLNNAGVQVNGNVLTYPLAAVTDEEPGTYTVALAITRASNEIEQLWKFQNIQIGTATVEMPAITKSQSCASCHEGPMSGKMYFAHVDVGRSPVGNWARDFEPDKSCKSCHNNDGYAAFRNAAGDRVPDHIMIRVHSIHMGEHLSSFANTNQVNGIHRHYTHTLFPADVRNCTKCHVDDRWKTKPSRLACGTCHDNTWFGVEPAPAGMVAHEGGEQISDINCRTCHGADHVPLQLYDSIAENHHIEPPNMDDIVVTMTPPANGTNYVAGEKPVITLVFKDDNGNPIDHTKVTDGNFSTASLFVYGPRAKAVPVLTSAARNGNSKLRASVSSSKAGPWAIKGKIFKIAVNGSDPLNITINGAADLVTAAEVVASLNPVIEPLGAKATVSGANVNMRTTIQGAQARFEIYNGDVTTAMGWKRAGVVLEPDVTIAAGTTQGNDLRVLADPLDYSDPMVTRNVGNITYQLDDVAGLAPGTYSIYVYHLPRAGRVANLAAPTGLGFLNFQVGIGTQEKKIAANCTSCHGDTTFHFDPGPIHAAPFDTDYCTACHDYGHVAPGEMFKNQGGTSLAGWSGFGAMPISRRVHAVHKGAYLEHPEEVYANATKDTFGHIIFPNDIRNCTKCHSDGNTTWKEKPSRVACLACHDSDAAKAHGKLNTFLGDPDDPYGPLAYETCVVCHGKDREFSADKLHRITNPYVPPYPKGE